MRPNATEWRPGSSSDEWWRSRVFYQIYPRSFQDTSGDGVGDLRGILQRLDHLTDLGVDAVWISPFFTSPMKDFGYDIADFCAIDPCFGTMEDFDRLIAEAHRRDIRIVLDFVPNHTSDQHPWFVESRSSRDNDRRDWYVWRDASESGGPPTNWCSNFGGSAWSWDEASQQFYYHAFLKEQPDLNWRNPKVRGAMHDVLRFWLSRGVDGFRVDAITNLVEDECLRDEPDHEASAAKGLDSFLIRRVFTSDRPETHQYVAEMRDVLDQAGQRVLIGEAHLPVARVMSYYSGERPGFHLPFNFLLLKAPWHARSIEAAIDRYLVLLPHGAWPNWVLGNHDEPRVATRIGEAQTRVAAMLTLLLPGTPFIYYGEEIGLEDTFINEDERRDPARPGDKPLGRDGARAPMPWDSAPNAGFTTSKPWLPLSSTHTEKNVAAARADPHSILNLYRSLIRLRRDMPAFRSGSYAPIACRGDLLGFERRQERERVCVFLNFGTEPQRVDMEASGEILLTSHLDRSGPAGPTLTLRPNEGVVLSPTEAA
jgi:alpha-glucosidase